MIKMYHGSRNSVPNPQITYSRTDIDFGAGFYLTENEEMAKKWACNKENSVLNIYNIELNGLRVLELFADEQWLQYILYNRDGSVEKPFDDTLYDVIIGPTADDKLFNTIDMYNDGYLSTEQAIEVINCMNYNKQIVFKNQSAIDKNVHFIESRIIEGKEKKLIKEKFQEDRQLANERSREIIKEFHRR